MGCKVKWQEGKDQFIQELFESAPKDESFYKHYLEPLFFDTLNEKRESLDEDCIIAGKNRGKVPFLNGGMFEKEDTHPEDLPLNWEIFNRFFEVLNSFNFTITEDDPGFREIAVDPEMLGHIFENLLEDNKDKGTFYTPKEIVQYMCQESLIEYLSTELGKMMKHDRLKEAIRQFVIKQHFEPLNDIDQKASGYVLQALRDIKVCDPAIGSGAFPMGILHEIFRMVENLADDDIFKRIWKMEKWDAARVKESIIQNSIYGVDIEKGAVDIARLRFWLSIIIEEDEPKPLPNLDYKIVVGDSLFNKFEDHVIDIEWEAKAGRQTKERPVGYLMKQSDLLSEISEKQKMYFDAPSSERNSLTQAIKDLKIDILINQLEMNIYSEGIKLEPKANNFLKKSSYMKAQKIYSQTLEWQEAINTLKTIKGTEKPFDHFDWNLDFPEVLNPIINVENKGFDVVVGNPPYLGNKEIGAKNQPAFFQRYGYKDDMYVYFFDKSRQLIKSKGVLAFITSNTFISLLGKQHLRKKFLALRILEFYEVGYVFDAAFVNTVITLIKNESTKNYKIKFKVASSSFSSPLMFETKNTLYKESLNNVFFIPSPLNLKLNENIFKKCSQQFEETKKWIFSTLAFKKNRKFIEHYIDGFKENDIVILGLLCTGGQGLVTGNNSKYLAKIVSSPTEREQIRSNLIDKIIKLNPIYDKAELANKKDKELYFIAENIKTENGNPSVFGKFFLYKTVFDNEVSVFDGLTEMEKKDGMINSKWIKYYRGNDDGLRWMLPTDEAILWDSETVSELKDGEKTNSRWQGSEFYGTSGFGWVDYFTDKIKAFIIPSSPYSKNIVKFSTTCNISNEYVVAILNSTLCNYYIKNFITNTHTLQINDGKIIPIKIVSPVIEEKFIGRVRRILVNLESGESISEIVRELDVMTYKVYDLLYSEIAQIDTKFWLSEDEYHNFSLEDLE